MIKIMIEEFSPKPEYWPEFYRVILLKKTQLGSSKMPKSTWKSTADFQYFKTLTPVF